MSITFAAWTRQVTADYPAGVYSQAAGTPEMNVSNANGWALLTALGIEPDYSGGLRPADMKGRVLAALALPEGDRLDLPADPATTALLEAMGAGAERGPTVIACERREGYVDEKMAALLDLCLWGEAHDADEIGWA